MTVERVENPATGEEIIVVKGEVAQISFKPIEPADKYGNTHRVGVRIGDDWVNNINIKTKEGNDPQVRFNNGNQAKPDWQTLEVGDDVRIVVAESEYNGKTYYNSGTSKIKLVKKGQAISSKPTASGGAVKEAFKPRDNTGVETGHALNGALNLARGGVIEFDTEAIASAAEVVHNITTELKKEYAEKNSKMSEYDVGAMVGNAVLNATRDVSYLEDIENQARFCLDYVVPLVSEYVKSSKAEKPKEEKKEARLKPGPAKRLPVKETPIKETPAKEVAESQTPAASSELSDMDDDIPFN